MTKGAERSNETPPIALPKPRPDGPVSVEMALSLRRSTRRFARGSVDIDQVGQLLWAAQGVTHGEGLRTAPSAGALQPLHLRVYAFDVVGLEHGLYRYRPDTHALLREPGARTRAALVAAVLFQECIRISPAVLIVSAEIARTTTRYGVRGRRYVYMEVGHVAQNVSLEAAALGLGATAVGAFEDDDVHHTLDLPKEESPLYLIPVGRRRLVP